MPSLLNQQISRLALLEVELLIGFIFCGLFCSLLLCYGRICGIYGNRHRRCRVVVPLRSTFQYVRNYGVLRDDALPSCITSYALPMPSCALLLTSSALL